MSSCTTEWLKTLSNFAECGTVRCTVYHLIILVDRIYWWLGCKLFSWICTLGQSWKKVLMSHTFDEISMVQHLKCSCDNKCDRIVMWPITRQKDYPSVLQRKLLLIIWSHPHTNIYNSVLTLHPAPKNEPWWSLVLVPRLWLPCDSQMTKEDTTHSHFPPHVGWPPSSLLSRKPRGHCCTDESSGCPEAEEVRTGMHYVPID